MGDYCPDGTGQQYATRRSSSIMPPPTRNCSLKILSIHYRHAIWRTISCHCSVGIDQTFQAFLAQRPATVGIHLSSTKVDSGKDLRARSKSRTEAKTSLYHCTQRHLRFAFPRPLGYTLGIFIP